MIHKKLLDTEEVRRRRECLARAIHLSCTAIISADIRPLIPLKRNKKCQNGRLQAIGSLERSFGNKTDYNS